MTPTPTPTPVPTLHLVRDGAVPLGVDAGDQVLYSEDARWRTADGAVIDDVRLHELIFAAAAVVVW